MRSEAPPLLPIFRSRNQADILAWLFLHPDREYSVSEIADRMSIAVSTVHDEVKRFIAAGILRERKVGRARLLRPEPTSRLFKPLSELLLMTFGPRHVVREEFASVG